MWASKRFTSTILFDSTRSEGDYYLDSGFMNKLYFYYLNNGYSNIITSQISNVLINIFTVGFVLFITKCIDYNKLISIKEDTGLSEIIDFGEFFQLDLFYWILLILFLVYSFCKVLSIIDDIISFKETKKLYNENLKIKDSELHGYKWNKILKKLKNYYNNDEIDAYLINNKIMTKDNYMIGLIDQNIIQFDHLTKLMEWNIMYCVVMYIFDDNLKIKKNLTCDGKIHSEKIKLRLRIVSLVNFVLMPFIFIFLIFFNLFEYCEKFYNSPKLINSRSFTLLAKWKFRYYNELFHDFKIRIDSGSDKAKIYMDQFHSKFVENLARFLIFLLSSLFTILIIFSILNENILLHLYITPEKTALWYIGIIVTAITLLKGLVNEKIIFYPKEKMKELRGDLQYLPQRFEADNDVIKIKKEFSNYFQYKVVILIKDLYYTLLVPFDLYKISYDVDRIVYFYQKNTLRHNKIGRTFKLSLFDNIFGLQNQRGDDKTVHSFNNFKHVYEDWYQDLASLQTSMNIA